MAAPTLSGSGGGKGTRRWTRSSQKPMSDINVTPFVDVMLVLLIVFMVTAPLLTVGVPVDLPKTQAKTLNASEEPLVITVNAQGELYIQEAKIEEDQLVPRLNAITENKPDTRVYVRGDKSIDYGRVMQVMGLVNSAGYERVALIAELPKKDK
ncbi:MAG: protein TolR [Halopseudomonas aestusnigri]